ncbi:MAG: Urease operon transcriptional activator [Luteibacter sp.]|uniref:helix-turn-helix transcriptional regulator n=1 Tax=Luteibacter sp. TaxID=1886636 RepID=UPI001382EDD0|nr:helix-turn-helix transcriptional regulator [Luteibacter sp.]KAF1008268.1 MAG: Urease operon transcriptional activator [Luteibacter sp.]
MELPFGTRIHAEQRYRIRTLAIHLDFFVAVVRGRKGLFAAGEMIEAGPSEGMLAARGTHWDVINDPAGQSHYEAISLSLDDAILAEFAKLPIAAQATPVTAASVVRVDHALMEAMRRTLPASDEQPVSELLLRHRAMEVLILLAERGWCFLPGEALDWPERVRRLVAQRPDAAWSVAALATTFHLSESTLRRRLESSGITLAALVREVRLETALGMLQTTGLPVNEVAHRCGWDSHSRFSAVFQQRWGVAPSVVRARLKETGQPLTENG